MPQLNPEFFITQLFWLVVTFSFLLVFLWRISLPRIGSVLEKREKKINDDIAAAKKLQEDAEKIQTEIEEKLKEVKNSNADLIKATSLNLLEKSNDQLKKLDNELNNKIEESSIAIEKNKNESMNKIESQIIEITKLTLSKISNININVEEIKEVLPSLEKKVN
tara:strand:+ start:304 stop:795 length:492 start_codon:yes stop_codon:yes gene_type:complete